MAEEKQNGNDMINMRLSFETHKLIGKKMENCARVVSSPRRSESEMVQVQDGHSRPYLCRLQFQYGSKFEFFMILNLLKAPRLS